ncbi:DUF2164 domain-containing protein [Chitinimonas sp.]|uniref:DUF2164 domain-containing protein n=1 Tax=Chitinimonas sp. TaxID=1934313 RepID=UPI002F925C04
MSIEISKADHEQAVASLQRYAAEYLDEPLGNLAAGSLLQFFLEEIGPLVYNQAVADTQSYLQAKVMEVDIEVHEDAFQYWSKYASGRRR